MYRKLWPLVFAAGIAFLPQTKSAAQQDQQTQFYGAVTEAGGAPRPTLVIEASINGMVCGESQLNGSAYALPIWSIPGCTSAGSPVNFWLFDYGIAEDSSQIGFLPPTVGIAIQLDLKFGIPARFPIRPQNQRDTTAPRAPNNLLVRLVEPGRALATWENNADNYDGFAIVDAYTDQNILSVIVNQSTYPAIQHESYLSGLLPDSQYCLYVTAFNRIGTSDPSNTACVTTPP